MTTPVTIGNVAEAEAVIRYVRDLVRENPPRDGKIQINLVDHRAFIDNGVLKIGPAGSVKIPADLWGSALMRGEDGKPSLFARQIQAIENERNCRKLIVFAREASGYAGTILTWNGLVDDRIRFFR